MVSKLGRAALAMLALMILLSGASVQAAPRESACPDAKSTSLYLGSGSTLAPMPSSSEGSLPIQASAGVALAWLVGSWSTVGMADSFNYGGSLNFSLWAKSSTPGQLTARFQVYVGVNDARPSSPLNSDSGKLSSTPKEFIGSGDISLNAKSGDTITVWVYSSERGTGGTLLFGGNYPSKIVMDLVPLSINLSISSRPGELKVSGDVSDIWGADDIDNITIAVMGPFSTPSTSTCGRDLYTANTKVVKVATGAQITTSNENESILSFSYSWKYDAANIKTGSYAIAVMVFTRSNATADVDAWMPLSPSKSGFMMGSSAVLLGVILGVVAVVLVGVSLYMYKSGKGAALAGNRKAVMAVGVAALLVVAGIGMFLTLTPAPSTTGEKAPDFKLKDVNGKDVSLSSFRGSVVVLDMMATWCPTCNQEIPELKDFHGKHPDVVIISIDVDKSENNALLKKHMESKGANWIYCMDTGSVMKDYHVTSIPLIVVVTPSGQITFMKADLVKSDELGRITETAKSGSAPILALGGAMGFAMLAFLAGLSAFFSPCAFPLLPGYMTYYIVRKEEGPTDRKSMLRKALLGGIAAALGILLVYLIIGIPAAAAGETVKGSVGLLAPIVAAIILVMGIIMMTNYDLPFYRVTALFNPVVDGARNAFYKVTKKEPGAQKGYYSGLLAYGAGYGAASLGCHAPIFITVLLAGLAAGGFASALLAFILYAIGMGLLMVVVTVLVGMAKTELVKKLQHLMPIIKKVSGLVLVLVGVVLLYSYISAMA